MSSVNSLAEVSLLIDGEVSTEPKILCQYGDINVYRATITNKRDSGAADEFYINYSSTLGVTLNKGMFVSIVGDIRTLNKKDTDFVIEAYINASSITILDSEPEHYKNECTIKNASLSYFKEIRKSYSNSELDIAMYQIKVERKHGRFSYFVVNTWGSDAVFFAKVKDDVKSLDIMCRLQSFVSKKSNRLYMNLNTYRLSVHRISKGGNDNNVEGCSET